MIFKNRKVLIGILFIASSILPLSSCSTVAITGRQRLNLVSDSSINSMARDQYSEPSPDIWHFTQEKIAGEDHKGRCKRKIGKRK